MSTELRLRIISAIILAIIVLGATWIGGLTFSLLSAAIGLLVYYEWSTITGIARSDRFGLIFGWISMALVAYETVFHTSERAFLLLLGFTFAAAVASAFRKTGFWLPGGIFYSGLSAVSLAALRTGDNGLITILFLFAVVWGSDILAYFVGRAVGGPKLAPKISPGKTWSGAVGGTIAGVLAGCLLIWASGQPVSPWLPLIAAILSIAGQIGDLFESWIKRRFGVKDSSHLIPGHGGVMDRVDALVFACFLAFLGGLIIAALSGQLFATAGGL
jgi:phosphatidate cytidylyltransferase